MRAGNLVPVEGVGDAEQPQKGLPFERDALRIGGAGTNSIDGGSILFRAGGLHRRDFELQAGVVLRVSNRRSESKNRQQQTGASHA